MHKINLHVITRCSRLGNLHKIENSVFNTSDDLPLTFNVKWHFIFDTDTLKEIPIEIYKRYKESEVEYHYESIGNRSLSAVNPILKKINDKNSWIYFLDDDNIIHKNFYKTVANAMIDNPDKLGFIFSQDVDKKDFTGLKYRIASKDKITLGNIDLAQYILHCSMFSSKHKFKPRSWGSDGIFIENLYKDRKSDIHIISDVACHYNYLKKPSSTSLPRILYVGEKKPDLNTSINYCRYTNKLLTKYIRSDTNILEIVSKFKPDAIITSGDNWKEFSRLADMSYETRKKWLNIPYTEQDSLLGQVAYECATNQMLANDNTKLISYFTPMYNTGNKLRKTYECLKNQTYNNWEWVLVNDSTDGGKTLQIAEEFAAQDPRVKVYDFREKSGGNIGEVKYRAAMLCRGHILAELDHDDHITPQLTQWLQSASEDHPECGFFYSDCAMATPDWKPRWFKGLHSFGYGSYRDEVYNGVSLKVTNQHSINPVTIRHIVGIPNHVRAWRRVTYAKLGGHCRDLSIADDYELVVRTFLHTRMCHIPYLGYVQFMYEGEDTNTHTTARADIQRRVKSIAQFYHSDIEKRFTQLGLSDWAYAKNPQDATASWEGPWPTGEGEQSANIVWSGECA
jgi:glycosyltransferase involved in cell wall biosynthesis